MESLFKLSKKIYYTLIYHLINITNDILKSNQIYGSWSYRYLSNCLYIKFIWYRELGFYNDDYYVCMCWDSKQAKIIESVEGGLMKIS